MSETIRVDLEYPRLEGHAKYIQVGLEDVRAADDLRIFYDFDRDGWVIEQASVWQWDPDDPIQDEDWQEVAFVRAWGRDPAGGDGE